jgi:hypothetical protein
MELVAGSAGPRVVTSGVTGNERMTALAGALLLALILVELATLPNLRALLSVHVFAGVIMAGPLAVKLGSTGYRFGRYYTRSPAYVRRGKPPLAFRLLAPLLIVTTLAVIGSGIGLVAIGPALAGPLLPLHVISVLVWLPALALHLLAHLRRVPRLIGDEWRRRARGRGLRLGVSLSALIAGAVAAVLVNPVAAPWLTWIDANAPGPLFMVAGLALAAVAVLAARALSWR